MITKTILALNFLLCLGLTTGCGSSGDSNKGAGTGTAGAAAGDHASAKDVTDYSQCNFGSQANHINGSWQQTFQDGEFTFVMTLDISSGQTVLTNDCSFHGRSLRASTSSPSNYNSYQLSVLMNNNDHEEINEGGFNMTCDAAVKPMSVSYSFQGSCLVMSDPSTSQKLVMLPKR